MRRRCRFRNRRRRMFHRHQHHNYRQYQNCRPDTNRRRNHRHQKYPKRIVCRQSGKIHKIMIPFNKPFLTGSETKYIEQAVQSGKLSGNGVFTQKCQQFFEKKYGMKKCLLTTSCTDALEMCAMLINAGPSDEIIIPSYTFVSTALAFVRQGAKVIFADSEVNNPNIDVAKLA